MSRRASILLPFLATLALLALPGVSQAASGFKWNGGLRVEPFSYGGLDAVSCASTKLCVAGDAKGNVYVTTNPSSTRNTWSGGNADSDGGQITGVSCPTTSFCVAVDSVGAMIYSTKPAGGSKTWSHPVRIDATASAGGGYAGLSSVSCPSASLCVAVDNATNSKVVYSTNPTGGQAAWHSASLGGQAVSVDCPSVSLCVIGGSEHWVSTRPSVSSSWKGAGSVSGQLYQAVHCYGTSLCLGVGFGDSTPGFAAATRTPTGSWGTSYQVASNPPAIGSGVLDAVGCTRGVCVALDGADNAYVSTTPVTGVWGAAAAIRTKSASQWNAVSCTGGICVVVDSAGVETTGILN